MAVRQLEYTPNPNKFDLRTHVWDNQGHLVRENLYRSFIVGGAHYFERPVNSGNLWLENNQPAGRVECKFNDKGHIISKAFDFTAPHKDFTAPLQGAAKVHYELEQERARSAQLEAELAQIRQEREAIQAVRDGVPAAAGPIVQAATVTPTLKPATKATK